MINKIKENIWQITFKEFGSCVYLIKLNDKNILVDTGSKDNREELIQELKNLELTPAEIDILIITHPHWDHIDNASLFGQAKIYDFNNIDELKIPEFKIFETPGHTQEDICILYEDVLFSGDVIFHNGYIGRTDFPESNQEKMVESLNKLKGVDYKILCPGHLV